MAGTAADENAMNSVHSSLPAVRFSSDGGRRRIPPAQSCSLPADRRRRQRLRGWPAALVLHLHLLLLRTPVPGGAQPTVTGSPFDTTQLPAAPAGAAVESGNPPGFSYDMPWPMFLGNDSTALDGPDPAAAIAAAYAALAAQVQAGGSQVHLGFGGSYLGFAVQGPGTS